MGDNAAVMEGYTMEVQGSNAMAQSLFLLVKPGTDFNASFKAWDTDCQEFIRVNGWLFDFEVTGNKWVPVTHDEFFAWIQASGVDATYTHALFLYASYRASDCPRIK